MYFFIALHYHENIINWLNSRMHVSIKKYITTVFFFVFLDSNIYSDNQITLEKTFLVGENEIVLSFSNDQIITYTKTTIFLDEQRIYSIEAGIITHAEVVPGTDIIFVVSIQNQENKKPAILTCQLISETGLEEPSWQVDVPYDFGLPEIIFSKSKIFFLWPESQTYFIYHLNGIKVGSFSLFEKSSGDHEKKLIPINHNNTLYLLGMASADLTNPENVHLFEIGASYEPKFITSIELTIPYQASISSENILATVGAVSKENGFEQTPYLFIYPLDEPEKVSTVILHKLPRHVFWHQHQIFLVFKDRIHRYNPYGLLNPTITLFNQPVFPLDIVNTSETIFMLTAGKITAERTGARFSSVSILIYDIVNNVVSNQAVSSNQAYSKVHMLHLDNSPSFYLQLDKNIYHYQLEH